MNDATNREAQVPSLGKMMYAGERCPKCGSDFWYPGDGDVRLNADGPVLACVNKECGHQWEAATPPAPDAEREPEEAYCCPECGFALHDGSAAHGDGDYDPTLRCANVDCAQRGKSVAEMDAESETRRSIAESDVVERYIRSLADKWHPSTTAETRGSVAGNLRGFWAWLLDHGYARPAASPAPSSGGGAA